MWIFCIWILFASAGAFEAYVDCDINPYWTCAPLNAFPMRTPRNEIELDHACVILIEYTTCVNDYEISCLNVDKETEKSHRNFLAALHRMCDEGSDLNRGLRHNIGCIQRIVDDETCYKESFLIDLAYLQYIGKEEDEMTDEDLTLLVCLHRAFEIGCYMRDVEDCGNEAKIVSEEIILITRRYEKTCSLDTTRTIISILRFLSLSYNTKDLIRGVLYMYEERLVYERQMNELLKEY